MPGGVKLRAGPAAVAPGPRRNAMRTNAANPIRIARHRCNTSWPDENGAPLCSPAWRHSHPSSAVVVIGAALIARVCAGGLSETCGPGA